MRVFRPPRHFTYTSASRVRASGHSEGTSPERKRGTAPNSAHDLHATLRTQRATCGHLPRRCLGIRPLTLIAGTNPFAVGSWRQIWARDVAFLHFSQTASLRPRSGGKSAPKKCGSSTFLDHCEIEGRRFGKNEEKRHLGPKFASRNQPQKGWFLRSNYTSDTNGRFRTQT